MKAVLGLGAALAAVTALVVGAAAFADEATPASATTPMCVTEGPLPGLSSAAAANARIVAAVAEQLGGSAAAVIAVMVGYTESGLLSLANPVVAGSRHLAQGTGRDHDSIGVFQQRASWGTVAQRMDPAQATRAFVTRLLSEAGWQDTPPWVAAQHVQRSAYDGRPRLANHESSVVGANYETNLALAQTLLARIDQDAAASRCGTLTGGTPANPAPGSHGLPADYVVPATADAAETTVVLFAIAQLDKPYVFGAAGPTAFDCSGLTMAAWGRAGVTLPHSAAAQAAAGVPTSAAALVPGDLVLAPGDDGTLAAPGHVGLYLGDGLVLNAADERDGIRVQTYADFVAVGHGLSALRHIE